MRQIQPFTILLVALVTTVCLAQSSEQTRSVVIDLRLPNGSTPQVRVGDGGVGSLELPNLGKFGFVPRIQADASTVVVDIFDLKTTPHERLGRV